MGGGKGGGGGSFGPSDQVPADFAADHPGATNADFFAAVRANEQRQQQQAQFAQLFGGFGGGHAPSAAPHQPSGPSDEENRIIEGENNRDDLYSLYLDSVEAATNTINSQIDEERSNALLLGIDFDISDEDKTTRITSEFSDLFTTSQFDELNQLFKDFGDPEGFDGFTITPGEGSGKEKEKEKTTTSAATKRPSSTSTSLLSEDDKLGSPSVLG